MFASMSGSWASDREGDAKPAGGMFGPGFDPMSMFGGRRGGLDGAGSGGTVSDTPLISELKQLTLHAVTTGKPEAHVKMPARAPDGTTPEGVAYWAPAPLSLPAAPTRKLSAMWIFQSPDGSCYYNLKTKNQADTTRFQAQMLHNLHAEDVKSCGWMAIAGAGAGKTPMNQESRLRKFCNNEFSAPAVPKQVPLPALVPAMDIDLSDICGKDAFCLRRICAECGAKASAEDGGKLKCCGRCKVRYCSLAHQAAAWPKHSGSCGQPTPTPESVATASPDELVSALLQFGAVSQPLVLACFARCGELADEDLAHGTISFHEAIAHAIAVHPSSSHVASYGPILLERLAKPAPSGMKGLDDAQLLGVLIRLPRSAHPALQGVCRKWRALVRNESFLEARRACPLTGLSCKEDLVIIVGGAYDGDSEEHVISCGEIVPFSMSSPMHHGRASMLSDGKAWVSVTPTPNPVSQGHVLVTLDEEVYCMAGSHGLMEAFMMAPRPCPCVMVWSPRTNDWRGVPCMKIPRALPAVCTCDGKIYLIGGVDDMCFGEDIARIECYNATTSTWKLLPRPMPRPCHGAMAIAIGTNIYVVGGSYMPEPSPTRTIQIFDTVKQKWTMCKARLPNTNTFAVAHENSIICLGGHDEHGNITADTWSLNLTTLRWTKLATAPTTHFPATGYFYHDGMTLRDAANTQLNYNIATNEWEPDPTRQKMRNHNGSCSPAVMSVPF
jgi:N-acetylneuraminic acid mutarotase